MQFLSVFSRNTHTHTCFISVIFTTALTLFQQFSLEGLKSGLVIYQYELATFAHFCKSQLNIVRWGCCYFRNIFQEFSITGTCDGYRGLGYVETHTCAERG